jgi:RNA recognition motif-containing protein
MSAQIFCANLAPRVDESELYALFGRFVDVRSAKVVQDKGQRRIGFVELLSDTDIERALDWTA